MNLPQRNRKRIAIVILFISMLVWVLLLFNPGHIMTLEHCHISDAGLSATSLKMLIDMNPPATQLAGWGLMVIAMMLPKLIMPVQHIYAHSFRHRRLTLSLVFILGYVAVWMAVGIAMIAVIFGLHLLMPGSYIPATGLGIIAVIWQFSPVKQRCLNRGHDHRILAAFGWPGYRDAFVFGVMHGVWCVGSGWALMLFPMLLPTGHNLAMIVVTFIMLSEHMEHPQVPRWGIHLRGKLFRIIVAQGQMKMNRN
jgi:predicted metal-binding membrane protein